MLHDRTDAHHDLTWLIGACARDLMKRGRNPGVMDMLKGLSAHDFSAAALRPVPAARANACEALPEAVTAAVAHAGETASALAAAHDRLPWREEAPGHARARVLGPDAPMHARDDVLALHLLLADHVMELAASPRDRLFFALTGPSRWRSEGAALLALAGGQTLFIEAGHEVRAIAGGEPLLVVEISA